MHDLIDRQEAIDSIESIGYIATLQDGDFALRKSAVDYVLRNLPSAQPEKCEDCGNFNKTMLVIPQPERKVGRWIYDNEAYLGGNPYGHYDCDQCGESVPHKTNFCPNCGTKMEEEEEEI